MTKDGVGGELRDTHAARGTTRNSHCHSRACCLSLTGDLSAIPFPPWACRQAYKTWRGATTGARYSHVARRRACKRYVCLSMANKRGALYSPSSLHLATNISRTGCAGRRLFRAISSVRHT